MRINLVTPFAEKDAVKALGARWDATKKLWYIVDVDDLTPFLRWIPDMNAAMDDSPATRPAKSAKVNHFTGLTTKSAKDVPDCGCKVLPWEDCIHTTQP